MLHLYSLYHLNLMYSSIDRTQRREVIKKCYWPLLEIAQSGIPIAVEATAVTLKIIRDEDPAWVDRLKQLLRTGAIEFVGSGYAQLIGPLVPWQVNEWNQRHGMIEYEAMLSHRPTIALVNEMAYSSGLVGRYLDAGYEALVMDWNNPYKYHPEWPSEYQFHPQTAASCEGSIPVIWSNFIAFQKFQRVTHGELSEQAYFNWLTSRIGDERRYFSLYSGDAEIFDYRPGRYATEADVSDTNEWRRIETLYQKLLQTPNMHLVRLSDVLKNKDGGAGNLLRLESPEQPIPVKKQEKYNIIRWALTGRDDQNVNTQCYTLFEKNKNTTNEDMQRDICQLWSSDYRTHITDDRWKKFNAKLRAVPKNGLNPDHQTSSPETLTQLPYNKENVSIMQSDDELIIRTSSITLKLNLRRGLTVSECTFSRISATPLWGTLEHGYYEDISFAADFYTGHTVVERPARHKVTDLTTVAPSIEIKSDEITLSAKIKTDDFTEKKKLRLSLKEDRLCIEKSLQFARRSVGIIRPMHVTFFPKAFSTNSLFFATHNGGKCTEQYLLAKSDVYHSESVSPLISAKHGLGATEGLVVVGDKHIEVHCTHDNSIGYVIPAIKYTRVDGNRFFLRLEYSAQEMDETFRENDGPVEINSRFELTATRGTQVNK